MHFRSTLVGILASAFLLGLLAFARLMVVNVKIPETTIREVEIATLPEPPPPPPAEEPPPEDAPLPPPALTDVPEIADPSRVAVPRANAPMDITLPVDPFSLETEVAPLPTTAIAPSRPQTTRPTTTKPSNRPPTPRPPPPLAKSHYQVNELDGRPRLIRHGSTVFPSSLARQGVTQGTVVLEVEISTSGGITVRRVISSTHAELVAGARRVASASRFTPPTRQGKPVSAIMQWPVTIKK